MDVLVQVHDGVEHDTCVLVLDGQKSFVGEGPAIPHVLLAAMAAKIGVRFEFNPKPPTPAAPTPSPPPAPAVPAAAPPTPAPPAPVQVPTDVKAPAPDVTIRATTDIPPFVGPNMQTYQLKAGDLATVPAGVADLLVRRQKATRVEAAA